MKPSKKVTKVQVWWKILMRASEVEGGPLWNKINITHEKKKGAVLVRIDGLSRSYHFHGPKVGNTWLTLRHPHKKDSHKYLVAMMGDSPLILSTVNAAIEDAVSRNATLMITALNTLKDQWNGPRTEDRDIPRKEKELRKRQAAKTQKTFDDYARRRAVKESEATEHQRAKTNKVTAAKQVAARLKKIRQESKRSSVKQKASVLRRHDEGVQIKSREAVVSAQKVARDEINEVIKAPAPERDFGGGCTTPEAAKKRAEERSERLKTCRSFNKRQKARESAPADYAPGGPQGKPYPPFPSPPTLFTKMDLHQWASHIAELNIHIQEHGVPSAHLLKEVMRVGQDRNSPPLLEYVKTEKIFKISRHRPSVRGIGLPRHPDFSAMDELVKNYQQFKSNRLPDKDRVLQQHSGIGPGARVRLLPHPVRADEDIQKRQLSSYGVTNFEGVVLKWIPPKKDQKQCGCWQMRLVRNNNTSDSFFVSTFCTARLEVLQRPLAVGEKMRVQALPGDDGVLEGKEVTVIGWCSNDGPDSFACGWNVSMTIAGQKTNVFIKNSPDGKPTLVPSLPPSEDAAAKQWITKLNRYSLFVPRVTSLLARMNGATGKDKKKFKKKLKKKVKELRAAEEKKQDEIIAACFGLEAPKPCAT